MRETIQMPTVATGIYNRSRIFIDPLDNRNAVRIFYAFKVEMHRNILGTITSW